VAVNDFIKIARDQAAATEAADFLSWVRQLRGSYEQGRRIRAKMVHAFNDSGGVNTINWAALQTLWGIPSNGQDVGPTANGAIVYNLVNGAVGSMEGSFQVNDAQTLTEKVG